MCPPGPHVFLLVVRADSPFRERERGTIEELLVALGEGVWDHAMVLFTCGDYLGDTDIQEHIKSEGKSLGWLVKKCRNRCSVMNNRNKGDGSQVLHLLEEIEEMVSSNNGRIFISSLEKQSPSEVKKRKAYERAVANQKRSEHLQSEMGNFTYNLIQHRPDSNLAASNS